MGLSQLLSVSPAVRAVVDLPHRYRSAPQGALPKFEPPAPLASRGMTMKTEKTEARETAASPGPVTKPAPANEPAANAATLARKTLGVRLSQFVSAARAWFSWAHWRPKLAARLPASARPVRKAVQQELRLEDVKVCRNDLSDSDWELAQPPKSGARLAFLRTLAGTGAPAAKRNRPAAQAAEVERI